MYSFRKSQFLRLVVLPLMLVSFLSGCHKWVPIEPSVDVAPEAAPLEHVRLTMSDGRMLELQRAVVHEDTVFGSGSTGSVAIPVDQIRTLEVRKGDTAGETGLVVAVLIGLVGAAVAAYYIACSGPSSCGGLR